MSQEIQSAGKRKFYIPARYVYFAVRVEDMFVSSFLDGLMPLAITSMVRATTTTADSSTTVANTTSTSSDVCPGAPGATNSSSSGNEGGDFDWNELMQNYVTNGITYGALVSMMLAARLVHMWSPKLMIIAASLLTIVITFLTPLVAHWSVYALIVARVVQGLATGVNMPALFALDSTWFPPDERQQLCAIIYGSVNVASIVSSSLTGYLIDNCGWEYAFYIFGGMKFIAVVVWFFAVFDSPLKHPRISEEETHHITSTVKKETKVKLPIPWMKILLSGPVWAYLIVSISNSWIVLILNTELPTYLKSMLYYSTSSSGYIVSGGNAAAFVIQLSSSFISQWLRRKGYISLLTSYRIFNFIVTVGTGAALIGITQSGCNTTAIVILLLLTKGFQSIIIAGSYLNHLDLAINFVPTLSAINGTLGSITGIISPTLAGAIINNNQTLTAWREVFYTSAAVAAFPYVIYFIFGSVDEQPWNKPKNSAATKAEDAEEPQDTVK